MTDKRRIWFVLPFLFLFHLPCWISPSEASWLIHEKRFHVSAHGQVPCADCHGEIMGQEGHPNPEDVNKDLTDFFKKEKCLSCHDPVMDELDKKVHGGQKIKNPEGYEDCIRCHDPHYQLRAGDKDRFDRGVPLHEQCGTCHETRSSLPPPSNKEKACFGCHLNSDPRDLCFHCHGQRGKESRQITAERIPPMDIGEYGSTPHADIPCTTCHPQAAQFRHTGHAPGDCRQCHFPHDEKVAHDAHGRVSCEACHLKSAQPVKDPSSDRILWKRVRGPGETSRIHHMILDEKETSCKRCHFPGNGLGAADMVLPAKGVLCMPCHTATFSAGDTTTIAALILFMAGMVLLSSYWLSGSIPDETNGRFSRKFFRVLSILGTTAFSKEILAIIKSLFFDAFLQRRLYKQSRGRWLIHALIFFPFFFRFAWGIAALMASIWRPEWSWFRFMLDKNHPATALLFDLTGIMVIFGIGCALIRGFLNRSKRVKGLPGQDRFALGLMAGIVAAGFILEGMRIAMTGSPSGAAYGFLGYAISRAFTDPSGLTGLYGALWYSHAGLTGVFVAYMPFSQMFHMVMAPVVLAMRAVSDSATKTRLRAEALQRAGTKAQSPPWCDSDE